ncbi:hypothetical protein FOCC_FOCC003078 [Frankliniella occidentalis]|nr:hypothetical protein FOCC_FOCC003078 [Frankliniella occidentalis]
MGLVPGPRMDYDEWTPLGHGDPLKNDPTYDYVPPVLDRVHYWMEPKDSGARRDEAFVKYVDSSVPVPPTMLVPPPPPPPPPPATSTTPGPLPQGPPPASAYSSLNPFHHFEDRPVVPNVLFEEKPLFEAPLVQLQPQVQQPQVPQPNVLAQVVPPAPQAPPPPLPPATAPFFDKPRATPPPLASESSNVVVQDVEKPLLGPVNPAWSAAVAGNSASSRPALKQASDKPNGSRLDGKPTPGKLAFPGPNAVRAPPGKPLRFDDQPPPPQQPRPPPPPSPKPSTMSPTTPASTSTALPSPPTTARPGASTASPSDTINSLVRGLLNKEVVTTVSTLTTDPLFAHYKQPVTPVNVHGPAYVIIQGHSKVKTYGPVLRRHDPPGHGHGGPPPGQRGTPKGTPARRYALQ